MQILCTTKEIIDITTKHVRGEKATNADLDKVKVQASPNNSKGPMSHKKHCCIEFVEAPNANKKHTEPIA